MNLSISDTSLAKTATKFQNEMPRRRCKRPEARPPVLEVAMAKLIDLVGCRFGNLIVLELADRIQCGKMSLIRWRVKCVRVLMDGSICGKITVVRGDSLRSGNTTSCGCGEGYWKHGAARRGQETPEFSAWENMRARCDEGGVYFGRSVYCEGFNDFKIFVGKLGPMTAPTLDRVQNKKGYYCGDCSQCIKNGWEFNCRWATRLEQSLNRDNNHRLPFEGREMCLSEWEKEYKLPPGLLYHRLEDLGWSIEDALKIPVGKRTRWSQV